MPRALVVFGTRPEAVKLGPVILELQRPNSGFDVHVCVTGQHRELLDAPLQAFGIKADEDLASMRPGQGLGASAGRIMSGLDGSIDRLGPDVIVVQGDTTSTFCGALAGFYARVPVVHVEAGLRTGQPDSPFPEEMNRRLSTRLASLHLAATDWAANNLRREGVAESAIRVTGNPGIDALMHLRKSRRHSPARLPWNWRERSKRLIAVTAHRRENIGEGLAGICAAVARLAARGDVQLAWPLHPNPEVSRTVLDALKNTPNVCLLPPLDYPDFVDVLAGADLVLTDSGGVQEEAPSVGTPALVLRESTERPEAIDAGTSTLVGCDPLVIASAAEELLNNPEKLRARSSIHNPYGDGRAAPRIVESMRTMLEVQRMAATA